MGNATRVAERTIYHQDADRYVERLFLGQTGLGSAREIRTRDSFNFGPLRTVIQETDYQEGHPELGISGATGYFTTSDLGPFTPDRDSRWILYPANYERRTEGGRTYQTDLEYNTLGQLVCSRRRAGANLTPEDVVTRWSLGTVVGVNAGLPVTETHFGGDGASVSTDENNPCPTSESSSQPTYVRRHTYQHLTLANSRIGSFPYEYRVEVDRATGLPKASFDVSGQRTALAYDSLGRLTQVTPAGTLREATTELVHRNPSGSEVSVEVIRRGSGGALLTKTIREFDGFGRLSKLLVQKPLSTGGWEFVKQETGYDAAGRKRDETTLQENCSPTDNNPGCTFDREQRRRWKDYLPDGRAQTVISPDGTAREYVYRGIRRVAETMFLRTSLASGQEVRNLSFYDSQGRVERVVRGQEEVGGNWVGQVYAEDYHYDPAGNLVEATRMAGGKDQERSYGWDGRGFLKSETHPELGPGGSEDGKIQYRRNALGLMRWRNDGQRTLIFEYDGAGRRTRVREGGKDWQRYVWGTSTSSSNLSLGKLEKAIRYNYIGGPGPESEWKVTETYTYGGGLGQVSQRRTEMQVAPPGRAIQVGPEFVTTWSYDRLGALVSTGYPQCVAATCTDSSDLPGAPRTVTTTYNVGVPVSTTSSQGLSAAYSYHRNLSLLNISYGNGTSSVFGPDPHGLARPRRIRHAKGTQVLYDSGLFEYDGAGNTWKIGADRFLYDRVGRVTLGTVRQAGSGHQETYEYDGFDNVLERVRNQTQTDTFPIDEKNRLLGIGDDVTYDVAGQMTQIGRLLDGSPNISVEWDGLGMQLAFKRHSPAFQQQVYIYGPGNMRLLSFDSRDSTLTWNQRDLSGKILRTWRHTGSLDVSSPDSVYQHDKDYLYGPQGMFASRSASGESTYFHNDQLGSPRLITDPFGQAIGRHHYYPFGQEVFPGEPYDDRICKFTGHERDPNGGTDYMLGRNYVFSFQRFMSVDPGRDGWNLYAYVGNNPLSFVDPTGNERAQIQQDRDARALLAGDISREEFRTNTNARGSMAGAAASLFVPGPEDVAVAGFVATKVGGRLANIASGAFGRVSRSIGRGLGRLFGKADEAAEAVPSGATDDLAELSGKLRGAARAKGNFGIGSGTREQAQAMGEAWVGPGFKVASDGKILISADGLRQFRPPSFKPSLGKFQANFETRPVGLTQWQSNAHLDILD